MNRSICKTTQPNFGTFGHSVVRYVRTLHSAPLNPLRVKLSQHHYFLVMLWELSAHSTPREVIDLEAI